MSLPDAEPAGPAIAGEGVSPQRQILAVHQERADRVVLQDVVLEDIAVAVHEMQPVAAVRDVVSADLRAVGEPHDGIAAAGDRVVLHDAIPTLPHADPVAPSGHVQILAADDVAADDAPVGPLEVDAEQDVSERVALDRHA